MMAVRVHWFNMEALAPQGVGQRDKHKDGASYHCLFRLSYGQAYDVRMFSVGSFEASVMNDPARQVSSLHTTREDEPIGWFRNHATTPFSSPDI